MLALRFYARYDSEMPFGLGSRPISTLFLALLISSGLMNGGCNSDLFQPQESAPLALSTVPAVRLNYRFEPDVPPPAAGSPSNTAQTIDAAVQADFDATRPFELLERTIPSPDKKRILAVYRHIADVQAEYRLDMYSPDGRL